MCCFFLMHTSTCTLWVIHCTSQTLTLMSWSYLLPTYLTIIFSSVTKLQRCLCIDLGPTIFLSGDTILWSLNSYPSSGLFLACYKLFVNMNNKSSFNWHFWLHKKFCVPGAKTLGPLLYAVLINTKNALNNNPVNRTHNK